MLVEQRTATLRPGKTPEYLSAFRQSGLNAVRRALGDPLALLTSEVGELNEVVSLVRFESELQRAQRHHQLQGDPEFQSFEAATSGLVVHTNRRLMSAPSYTALRFDHLARASSHRPRVFIERRTYTLSPGTLADFLSAYGSETYEEICRIRCVLGVFLSQLDGADQFVAFGAYETFEQRAAQRDDQYRSEVFTRYAKMARPLIVRQQSQLFLPVCSHIA